jgi:hypothetical protein
MPCVFCGFPKTTNEHVFPKWLRDVFPGRAVHYSEPPPGDDGEIREWRAGAINHKANVVCQKECNGGWMSRLEGAARPHVEPLITGAGRGRSLDAEARRLIAFWALKTAFMTNLAQEAERQCVPASDYTALYAAQDVLPNTFVWLGATTWVAGGFSRHRIFDADVGDSAGIIGWSATIQLGHLVIEATRIEVPDGYIEVGGGVGQALRRVWPQDEPVIWPPDWAMTREQALDLARLIEQSPMRLIPGALLGPAQRHGSGDEPSRSNANPHRTDLRLGQAVIPTNPTVPR